MVTLRSVSWLKGLVPSCTDPGTRGLRWWGHTDNASFRPDLRKGFCHNQELFRSRVDYAVQLLLNEGLQGDRVKVVGNRGSKLMTTNGTDNGWSKNRR